MSTFMYKFIIFYKCFSTLIWFDLFWCHNMFYCRVLYAVCLQGLALPLYSRHVLSILFSIPLSTLVILRISMLCFQLSSRSDKKKIFEAKEVHCAMRREAGRRRKAMIKKSVRGNVMEEKERKEECKQSIVFSTFCSMILYRVCVRVE